MLRKLIRAGAIVVLVAGTAAAQDTVGIPLNPRKAMTPEQIEKQRASDEAYKAAMKKIPDKASSTDPWGNIRPGAPDSGQEQATAISAASFRQRFRRSRGRCYKDNRADCFENPARGRGEMVDARDLKSLGRKLLCRFESGRPHQSLSRVPAKACSGADEFGRALFQECLHAFAKILRRRRRGAGCGTRDRAAARRSFAGFPNRAGGSGRARRSGRRRVRCARRSASPISASSSNTRLTRPHASAVSAGRRSPSSDSSIARARPTSRGSSQVEPQSGTRPMRRKACRK